MALNEKTSSFGFSNATERQTPVHAQYALGSAANYAVVADEPTECVTSNTTCPVDQEEILTYRCKRIPTVNTAATIQYPNPVRNGVQYTVSLDEVLRTVDDADGYQVDHPIVAYLVVRHDLSGDITDDHLATVVARLYSAFYHDDGTPKFAELRRSALKPNTD